MRKANVFITNKSCAAHHSSSRKVSMRDIVVGFFNAPLYPAHRHCGMTNGAERGFPSHLAGEGARRAGEGYKKAFTLIELLVVVLIIGILAAVAVPQYKKAVVKSRLANMKQIMSAVKTAEEAYYLTNGTYTEQWAELDIDLPNCPPRATGSDVLICDNYFMLDPLNGLESTLTVYYCPDDVKLKSRIVICENHSDFTYTVWLDNSEYPGKYLCTGKTNLGKAVCKGN